MKDKDIVIPQFLGCTPSLSLGANDTNNLPPDIELALRLKSDTHHLARLGDTLLSASNIFGKKPTGALAIESYKPYGIEQDPVLALEDGIANGIMPAVGSGWSFVVAEGPSVHPRTGKIDSKAYTGFFSRGEIPIAPIGTVLRVHDLMHVRAYQVMMGDIGFAGLVRLAAEQALSDGKHKIFTACIDSLGDLYDDIANVLRDHRVWSSDREGQTSRGRRQEILQVVESRLKEMVALAGADDFNTENILNIFKAANYPKR